MGEAGRALRRRSETRLRRALTPTLSQGERELTEAHCALSQGERELTEAHCALSQGERELTEAHCALSRLRERVGVRVGEHRHDLCSCA